MSKKISSELKRILLTNPNSSKDCKILLKVSESFNSGDYTKLEQIHCKISSKAGNILTIQIPIFHVFELANFEFVLYIEGASPLFLD
jgi:hypothetical protein